MQKHRLIKLVLIFCYLSGSFLSTQSEAAETKEPSKLDILDHYANMATAIYEDALWSAQMLQHATAVLLQNPNKSTHLNARAAWKLARQAYQQSEAYRFGNPVVDAWEGKVNAWPLDEGLIDYVDMQFYGSQSDENPYYNANVIANPKLILGNRIIDAEKIDKRLLRNVLHEADGIEANIATGYHAIEFLLWGQDLNGTSAGAGDRPYTDFDVNNCSGGNCARRAEYLRAVVALLIDDLQEIIQAWSHNGEGRKALLANTQAGIVAIINGIGSLSYGELAGERMQLGLMLQDPEEEHDCFSDNTHNSHYYNQIGIINVYSGHFVRIDGSFVSGPSLSSLVAANDAALDSEILNSMEHTRTKLAIIKDQADRRIMSYDQMLSPTNEQGNKMITDAIAALKSQTKSIEQILEVLKLNRIGFEGSNSLDSPNAVFQ